jgi:hypothetical protein
MATHTYILHSATRCRRRDGARERAVARASNLSHAHTYIHISQLLDADDEMELMSEQWRERLICVMDCLGEHTRKRSDNGELTDFEKAINRLLVTLKNEANLTAIDAAEKNDASMNGRGATIQNTASKPANAAGGQPATPQGTASQPVTPKNAVGGPPATPKNEGNRPVLLDFEDQATPRSRPPGAAAPGAPAHKGDDPRGSGGNAPAQTQGDLVSPNAVAEPGDGASLYGTMTSNRGDDSSVEEDMVYRRLRRRMKADFRLAKGVLEALLACDTDAWKETEMRKDFEKALRGMMDKELKDEDDRPPVSSI